jgi:co-chaperonin GroES (HSP10)
MDKIIPFGNNILIAPRETNTILKGYEGTLCEYGEVLAIGSDVQLIKVGDIVGFTKWGIKELIIDEKKYKFIPEDTRFILGTFTMRG